jgi:hypothetical protein
MKANKIRELIFFLHFISLTSIFLNEWLHKEIDFLLMAPAWKH